MTKSELIDKISTEGDLTKSAAAKALQTTLEAISEALKEGDSVTLTGFGTFSVADQKEREGRNPQTGETMTIPAKRVPKFKPGKQLKEMVAS